MVFLKDLKLIFEEDTLYIILSILYHKNLTSRQILNLMNYIFGQKRGGHIKCLGREPLFCDVTDCQAPIGLICLDVFIYDLWLSCAALV